MGKKDKEERDTKCQNNLVGLDMNKTDKLLSTVFSSYKVGPASAGNTDHHGIDHGPWTILWPSEQKPRIEDGRRSVEQYGKQTLLRGK